MHGQHVPSLAQLRGTHELEVRTGCHSLSLPSSFLRMLLSLHSPFQTAFVGMLQASRPARADLNDLTLGTDQCFQKQDMLYVRDHCSEHLTLIPTALQQGVQFSYAGMRLMEFKQPLI